MNLVTVIENIERYIANNIENPNFGGCGWIAYYVYKECVKRNINCALCLCDCHTYDKNCSETTSNNFEYINADHVWLICRDIEVNYEYDEVYTKVTDEKELDRIMKCLRKSLLKRTKSFWNKTYDTSQNDKLRKVIKYYFNQLAE